MRALLYAQRAPRMAGHVWRAGWSGVTWRLLLLEVGAAAAALGVVAEERHALLLDQGESARVERRLA